MKRQYGQARVRDLYERAREHKNIREAVLEVWVRLNKPRTANRHVVSCREGKE